MSQDEEENVPSSSSNNRCQEQMVDIANDGNHGKRSMRFCRIALMCISEGGKSYSFASPRGKIN